MLIRVSMDDMLYCTALVGVVGLIYSSALLHYISLGSKYK